MIRKFEDILAIVGGSVSIAVIGTVTCADVIGRFVFGAPVYGAVEVSIIGMAFIVFFPLALGEREGGNIRVDFLLLKARGKLRDTWEAIISIISFIFYSFWSWRLLLDAYSSVLMKQEMMASVITFPIWPAKIAIAVGMIFLSLRCLIQFVSYLRIVLKGEY